MVTPEERDAVEKAYGSASWKQKVRHEMSEAQIKAIYLRLKAEGKL